MESIYGVSIDWLRHNIENGKKAPSQLDFNRMLQNEEHGNNELFHHTPLMVVAHGDKNTHMWRLDGATALADFDIMADSVGLGC